MILLDSTVIVGFLDADDALHATSVKRLKQLAGDMLAASVISYAEVMTGAQLGHHSAKRVNGFFDSLIHELLTVDKAIAARAAALRGKRKSLTMPDALILAGADSHPDIDTVLCADADWTKVSNINCRIELVSP
ncbi:MAG TPA: PIN domain-containing protein [Solirubrobacteraceae bacterium]|nr:PIN domain-containing protein [Solirubrobacteraceae bacterium]